MNTSHPTALDFSLTERIFRYTGSGAFPLSYRIGGALRHGADGLACLETRVSYPCADVRTVTLEGTDAAGLRVRAEYTEYRDYPVTEWVFFFTNTAAAPSELLTDAAIGGCIPGGEPLLCHGNGDTCAPDGYSWTTERANHSITVEPQGGTSCRGAFPYMRLLTVDAAVNIAVGWPGHWRASFAPVEGGTAVSFGQSRLAARLLPGETFRTPRITMMISAGGEERSRNMWRRWYLAHILPREDGRPLPPKLVEHLFAEGGKPEFTGATEAGQLRALRTYCEEGLRPDIWWIDAGWYPCAGAWQWTGTWKPDGERFPHGLTPIGEECRRRGIDFLLWFEPERARPHTELHDAHPEWMLRRGGEDPETEHCLVNLAEPACCDWLIDRIDRIIKESGVRVYRQDFNYFDPDAYWIHNEAPERAGALENLHVQGYLRLWDTLLVRNPGLWIDSCASGGRRNDLETMRRAVPLHYTDVGYGDHPIKQKQHRQMFEWIPYFRAHNMSWDTADGTYRQGGDGTAWGDEFSFHAAMAPSLTSIAAFDAPERERDAARRMIPVWRRAAELMLRADYYPLTECRANAADMYAMQFDDPDSGDGFLQVLRNTQNEEEEFRAFLCALTPDASYRFSDPLNGNSFVLRGEEAAAGISVRLPKRSAVLYFYQKI